MYVQGGACCQTRTYVRNIQHSLSYSWCVWYRYVVHLWDMHHSGHWENKAAYMHYVELVLELAALSVDFMHHLHMIVSNS